MDTSPLWIIAAIVAVGAVLTLLLGEKANRWNKKVDRVLGGKAGRMNPKLSALTLAIIAVAFAVWAIVKS